MSDRAARPRAVVAVVTLILGVVLLLTPARATEFDSSTVATSLSSKPTPAIVLEPATGIPHILYANQTTVYHARMAGGTWLYEVVSTSRSSGSRILWAVSPTGRLAAGFFNLNSRFVCSVSDGNGWEEDTSLVDATNCTGCLQWLAFDPVSNEPCVAYATALAGGGVVVRYAWRQGGVWSVSDVDSTGVLVGYALSLAVDDLGRPSVAYTSSGGDSVLVASRESAGEPFTREVAAAGWSYYAVSMAVAPGSGAPRVAYFVWDTTKFVGYAARAAGTGVWTDQLVDSWFFYLGRPVSLALDPDGNPTIAYTREVPILAAPASARDRTPRSADPSALEGGGTSGWVEIASRTGGEGTGPFQIEGVPIHDLGSGPQALAVRPTGQVRLAVRHPDIGPPYSVLFVESLEGLPVLPPAAGALSLPAPAPNPGRGDQAVRVSFVLPRDERAALELLDLEGRRVAHLPARSYHAGPNTLQWSPGPLPAGLYWLRLHSASGLSATRKWVVLR